MSDLPKFVGPFEIRDRLGHGGMGMVYLGHDPMLDRSVAVKVLRVPDDETRRRFLREARLHAKVQHPHIVNIYAVGEHEGQPYLAMEYIAGSTMAAIIRSGDDVPLARKVTWLAELSAGLDHAHHYGIVHRDVKPSNILITRDTGRLRLLDFGIAHGQEALGMTVAGMVIGTPQYMSPEQITGKPVDARSDIFSVGLVGYELLTGRQAFGGDNVFDISRRIVGEPPEALVSLCRDAPMSLVRIIEKCLEKAPDARYQDARQLERELLSIARRLDPDHTVMSMPLTAPTMVVDTAGDDDPSTAAAALATRVRDAVNAGRLSEAEQLLRDLQARHARVPGLSGLRVLVEEARQASQAVNLAADAERALARMHLTEAQALIADIERLAPSWEGLGALRQQLQTRQHERRVEDALQRARGCLDAGALDEAEPALRELASLAPQHDALTELRSRYHGRIAVQQAAALASRARGALQQDQLDDAAALVAEALAIAPGNDEALAVQELVGQRRRAQRLARAAQKVGAAIEAGQPVSARKALEQLQRMDAAHPDIDALRARVERLERGEEPDTTTGPRGAQASSPGPPPSPVAPSTGLDLPEDLRGGTVHQPSVARPVPAAAALVGAAPAMALHGPVAGDLLIDTGPPDDELHISRAELPVVESPPRDDAATGARGRLALLAVAAVLIVLAGGAGYWFVLRTPAASSAAAAAGAATGLAPAALTDAALVPDDEATTDDGGGSGSDAAPADVAAAKATEPAKETHPTAANTASSEPRTSAADAMARVADLAGSGRFADAFAALGAVPGLRGAALQAEQRKLAEAAQQRATVARSAAVDLRAGTTNAYMNGVARQTLGDQHFTGGRMRDAALEYVRARDAFELALSTRAGGAAGASAGAAGTTPAKASGTTTTAAPSTPPSSDSGGAGTGSGPTSGSMQASYTREQVEAVVGRFRQAYESRSMDGLRRVWPSMDPSTERVFRGRFGIPGELQWMPLSQRVVWQSDRATVIATVLTISPLPEGQGQDRREVKVTFDVVPQGTGLVIANFRQQ